VPPVAAFGHNLFLQAGQGHFTGLLVLDLPGNLYKVDPPQNPKIAKLTNWLNSIVYDIDITIHGVEKGGPCMIQCRGLQIGFVSRALVWFRIDM